jgi:phosphoesterase RecJ-like protein
LSRALVDRAGRIGFDTDQVLDSMRSVEGTEVVALLKERLDGVVKLSLRASGDIDVNAIATQLGGGGHRKASGATLNMSMTKAVARVEELVRIALDEPPREGK